MDRRTFLKMTGLTIPALSFNFCAPQRKPNIVLILVDDMGWKDVGFMGSTFYETPHIDRLASEGIIFTDAYSNAPNCAPSRASLLTGLYPPRHGIYTVNSSARGKSKDRKLIPVENTTILDPSFKTLAEYLQENGYRTASIGKWHLGEGEQTGPEGQGFNVNIAGTHMGHPPAGYFAPYNLPGLEDAPQGQYLTDRLTDEAVKFIEANKDNPFFLYLPHYAVHTPLQSREEITEKYARKKGSGGQNNPVYAGMIESTDRGIGRIADIIEKLGLDKNTVIIFTSDNGGVKGITSSEPLRGGKGMLYEGGIRVPMFVRWPGAAVPGRVSRTPVIGLDLFATILEMAGIPGVSSIKSDGSSIYSEITGGEGIADHALHWHFPAYLEAGAYAEGSRDPLFRTRPAAAIRKGSWKLIEYFEDGELELFYLDTDISESENLADEHPDKRDELHNAMLEWRKATNAPLPRQINP